MHEHMHDTPASATSQSGYLGRLFEVYVPRQVCMNYESDVIVMHIVADILIAAAYYSIPLGLAYFVRKRLDLAYQWMFWLFAAFILFCGTTHIFNVIAIWHPLYRLDGVIKLLTGFISVATAIMLWPIIPKALMLPSPAQLEQRVIERTAELSAEVSARTAAEVRERDARSQAEFANRAKDEFLATLSHELRTPINAILGWTQIVRRGRFDPKDTHEAIDVIERNARSQAQLIEELLDMSRIISGKLRLEMQATDINRVIEAAAATIQPGAMAKGVQVDFQLQKDIPAVNADPYRMQQIIWNLLSNALKFTPTGGCIRICSRFTPAADQTAGYVWVDVTDTGIGIDSEFLPRIFERFWQADAGANRKFGGLGLGLAIVRHLVEAHGGTIAASSAGTNQGSTFTIRLPAVVRHVLTDGAKSPAPESLPDLKGMRILLVDDQLDTLIAIRRLLQDVGASVTTADSAPAALAAVEQDPPAILLSDIGMPGEDGYSLIAKIRQLPPDRGGKMPAVAITAFARSEDRIKALNAGFQMHLAKPIDAGELIATVAALTRKG